MEKTPSLDQTVESTVAFEHQQKTFLNLQHTLEIHCFDAKVILKIHQKKHQGGTPVDPFFFGGSNQATKQHHQLVGRLNSEIFEAWPIFVDVQGRAHLETGSSHRTVEKYRKVSEFRFFFSSPRLTAMRITFPESFAIAVIPSQNTMGFQHPKKKTPGIFNSAHTDLFMCPLAVSLEIKPATKSS